MNGNRSDALIHNNVDIEIILALLFTVFTVKGYYIFLLPLLTLLLFTIFYGKNYHRKGDTEDIPGE